MLLFDIRMLKESEDELRAKLLIGLIKMWQGTHLSTRKLISSSFHRLDMTLAVAEAVNPNKPNQTKTNPNPFVTLKIQGTL